MCLSMHQMYIQYGTLGPLIMKVGIDPELTLSASHATIVVISRLVKKVPSQELLSATEFSMRLV